MLQDSPLLPDFGLTIHKNQKDTPFTLTVFEVAEESRWSLFRNIAAWSFVPTQYKLEGAIITGLAMLTVEMEFQRPAKAADIENLKKLLKDGVKLSARFERGYSSRDKSEFIVPCVPVFDRQLSRTDEDRLKRAREKRLRRSNLSVLIPLRPS